MLFFLAFALAAIVPSPTAFAQYCGDGNVDPGEQCDDSNTDLCDGCDANCQWEPSSPCPWPDGVVYFEFDGTVSMGNGDTEYLRRAMDTWSQTNVDVVFLPRNGLANVPYVIISNDTGGNGTSGPQGAPSRGNYKTVNINNLGMNNIWFPVHELGHVLGFEHEMKHPDRDLYLTIHDENIDDTEEDQYSPTVSDMIYDTNTFGFSYDSIMLYPECFDVGIDCSDCPNDATCTAGGVNMSATDGSQQSRMGFDAFSENNEQLYSVDIDRAVSVYGSGKVRYVNDQSNDPSNGTLEEPYTSFSDAKNNAPDGARIYIKGGPYDIANTQTKPMTLQAYPNDPVTIQ